ncbi:hypothetical protein [Paenibacillus sp. OV219]|uniref:hypothetical protein n=1 Tax=Paenibacillus sp. OV219 TaxID=1884377 RepID=UPI0008D3FDF9|nr:hypothetical protein [Paenibacillus sp. OV219]SEO96443.1 hypothetical protein SAMN05518847_113120 [Paenibacillus sp. OV219]
MNPLDQLFHRNVLFLICCIVVSMIIVWRLPRGFPRSMSIIIMLFSLDLAKGLDNTIGLEPFIFYNTNINPKFDFADALTWVLYPMIGYLFTYIFNRYRIEGMMITIYIIAWSCFAIVFECVCVYFEGFTYIEWKLYYSFCVYLTVQMLYVLMFTTLKRRYVIDKREAKRSQMQA